MSDDFGRYRSGPGDEDEPEKEDRGSDALFGWPDDEPGSREGAESGWPASPPPPEQPSSGRTYLDYGYTRPDDALAGEAASDRYGAPHSRDPLARLFPGLPRGLRVTLDWILTIAGAILIVLALKEWVVNPYRIPSSSMEPALHCAKGLSPSQSGCLGNSSDRVLACRICLDFRSPSRGDIVVFNTPKPAANDCGEGGTFVKRVIGLPGETVKEDDSGFIWIRGPTDKKFVRLKEPYVSKARRLADSNHFGGGPWHVPEGDYFMMGDNRAQSCDSRTWGAVPRSKLIGIVFFVYWPPDRIGFR